MDRVQGRQLTGWPEATPNATCPWMGFPLHIWCTGGYNPPGQAPPDRSRVERPRLWGAPYSRAGGACQVGTLGRSTLYWPSRPSPTRQDFGVQYTWGSPAHVYLPLRCGRSLRVVPVVIYGRKWGKGLLARGEMCCEYRSGEHSSLGAPAKGGLPPTCGPRLTNS